MARYTGGDRVSGGYYWNPRHWSISLVSDRGGELPGTSSDRYLRISWATALLLAPLLGGLFVVLLPFIGLGLFFRLAWRKLTGSAREGARDLAATMTPGWRPGEAHMTGRSLDPKAEQLPAGGAGESALGQVADEVARKRRESGNGNGND
jgi:hypothetical protein